MKTVNEKPPVAGLRKQSMAAWDHEKKIRRLRRSRPEEARELFGTIGAFFFIFLMTLSFSLSLVSAYVRHSEGSKAEELLAMNNHGNQSPIGRVKLAAGCSR